MRHYLLALTLFSFWLILQKDQGNLSCRVSLIENNPQLTMAPVHSTKEPKSKRSLTTVDEPCIVNRETLMILYGLELKEPAKLKERPRDETAKIIHINFREQKPA
jgi:hypothetical protein